MKALLPLALAAATTSAADLSIQLTNATQLSNSDVAITYNLGTEPAVVTLDVRTNGVSIGAENLTRMTGDVNKLVNTSGEHYITWAAASAWPDHRIEDGSVTFHVKAWATNNPPPYMVWDITANDTRYYLDASQLPEGGLTNDVYRTDKLVLRKIDAAGESFTMGEPGAPAKQQPCPVTLSRDYYIGIFEFTHGQLKALTNGLSAKRKFTVSSEVRPAESVSFNDVRGALPPADATSGSLIGKLRAKSGGKILFDLPSDAEWEFAARAGASGNRWPDGTYYTWSPGSSNDVMDTVGRYRWNGGSTQPSASQYWVIDNTVGLEHGTARVGSYKPNAWGLYDVCGNVWELCAEVYTADIDLRKSLAGTVNTTGTQAVNRSGSWNQAAPSCVLSIRDGQNTGNADIGGGFRVMCPAFAY